MTTKREYKKEFKALYAPSEKEISVVEVPALRYLMVDGAGNPNTSTDYADAVSALYAVAYAIRFAVKRELEIEYSVMPLEGLWWADDMETFLTRNKEAWQWTMMLMQPDIVTLQMVEAGIAQAAKKKELVALPKLRVETYREGNAVQILYRGSYDGETETIAALHAFIQAQGHQIDGKHHEIYLSDPRKVAAEKLKTVIRQPFRATA